MHVACNDIFLNIYLGKEVAIYCAAKLGDIIKATNSYSKGDICQALKDAFMKCDEIVMKPETVQEMKKMINIGISAERYIYILINTCMFVLMYAFSLFSSH